ncbi:MAG: DNA mismatch repair endonuclease MutL [Nitrospiraceae bacterium]|nr:DNA mismatch repair endonuclease MutL [Nitrospiraceae bacterium]
MGKIKVLPPEVIDKLRAGEVVERPASALKELIENSVDAGASHIRVEVKKGGKRLISVMDDGEGMDPADALLCLDRHSTSKLEGDPEGSLDISGIRTLGFRGEALPSISSVSELAITTAPRGASEGVRIEAKAGKVTDSRPAPASGTRVEVRELFFNTPARKKFLKSGQAENFQIMNVLTKQALAHPGTGFTLHLDGRMCMELDRAADIRERILQIYGSRFLEGLIEQNSEEQGLKLKVFFSKEGNWRGSRSHQFIFVSGRPVRDASLGHAVYGAISGLPQGRHPVFFIFLEPAPDAVDVNVHPQKEEVRFEDKEQVYRLIRSAVREACLSHVAEQGHMTDGPDITAPSWPNDGSGRGVPVPASKYPVEGTSVPPMFIVSEGGPDGLPFEQPRRIARPFIRLGEMFYAYTDGAGVTLLDQHAAHERVMFERLLRNVGLDPGQFLFPRPLELAPAWRQAVLAHRELLLELGFEIDDFGEGLILRGAPQEFLKKGDLDFTGLIADMALELMEEKGGGLQKEALKKKIAARLACHSSVRGSDVLTPPELEELLDALEGCEDPGHCPHGRPTRISLGLEELKRMFKRK